MGFKDAFRVFPDLETDRLLLREFRLGDALALYNYFSNKRVTRYLDWEGPDSVEDAQRVINGYKEAYRMGDELLWAVALKEDDSLIGGCRLWDFRTESIASLEYQLSSRQWGKGYMHEALQAILEYAFTTLELHRLQAFVVPDNEPSLRLLRKLHFKREGLLRQYEYHQAKNKFHDVLLYSLLQNEFQAQEKGK